MTKPDVTAARSPWLLAAAAALAHRSSGRGQGPEELLAHLTDSELAEMLVGNVIYYCSPWDPARNDTLETLRADSRLASLAAAVRRAVRRLPGGQLHLPQTYVDDTGTRPPHPGILTARFPPFPAAATKPVGALWTSSPLDGLASIWLTDAPADWSTSPGKQAWALHTTTEPRVYEINGPDSWVELCDRHPADTTDHYQPRFSTSELSFQAPFITPDWDQVAGSFDAVHLSWHGLTDCSDQLLSTSDGFTCLTGWGSEGTFWFRWLFTEPQPLPGTDS